MKLRLRRRKPDELALGRPSSCHCWTLDDVDPFTFQVSMRNVKHRSECPLYRGSDA